MGEKYYTYNEAIKVSNKNIKKNAKKFAEKVLSKSNKEELKICLK